MRVFIGIVACFAFAMSALGHKLSDSYLKLSVTNGSFQGQWEIALKDLEYAVGLDANNDLQITWGEVKARRAQAVAHLQTSLAVSSAGQALPVLFGDLSIASRIDGAYAVFPISFQSLPGQSVLLSYNFLFDADQQHRGLLNLDNAGTFSTIVFSPSARAKEIGAPAEGGSTSSFAEFVREGMLHIWKGLDHVLFLLALLLPSVLIRKSGEWLPAEHFRSVLIKVVKVVTSFTVAHSITLIVASLGWVHFPAHIIEPIIACSVVFAALNNIFAWFREGLWRFTFVFGLVHGFGFAFVLEELGLNRSQLFSSLVGFNLGVELGQLAIVALVLPIIFLFRYSQVYSVYTLKFGSLCISLVAATWMFERIFSFKVLPF